jgi:hypothetical protein
MMQVMVPGGPSLSRRRGREGRKADVILANAIEIRVDRVSQLFHTLDPFPFRERDLDKEAEEFIVGWARELPKSQPIKIIVHLPAAEAASKYASELSGAVSQYFRYRADAVKKELRELFRIGRFSLLIGIVVLALCVVAGRLVLVALGKTDYARFLNEGLIILGWVANWRPIEIFLYEWWPLVRRRKLYLRLADSKLEIAVTD